MGRATTCVAVVVAVGLSGCGGAESSSSTAGRRTPAASTEEYTPGVEADVHLPPDGGAKEVPVVVLVPGGAWLTADRTGLDPLARALAAQGMVVVNATYRAASAGAKFLTPVNDILCAVAFAVSRTELDGLRPARVVVVGHSSGAHLAALAALRGDHFGGDCAHPATSIDAFVGLAGVYDVAQVADAAEPLFGAGPRQAPELWREGNAFTWVDARPSLPVLLAHGDADELVPPAFTARFADALRTAGHRVDVEVVPGADHDDLYAADVVAVPIERWISALPAR